MKDFEFMSPVVTVQWCNTKGFTDWKHTFMGDSKKSVPDSCCLFEAPGCGQNLFEITDIRMIVQKININGEKWQSFAKFFI